MKPRSIATMTREAADIRSGKVAPARVWVVKKRADGTISRKLVAPALYQASRKLVMARGKPPKRVQDAELGSDQPEPEALSARRNLGVSQDRLAELLGIRPGTLRNWEQGRCQPTGPARVLVRLLRLEPQMILKALTEFNETNAERIGGQGTPPKRGTVFVETLQKGHAPTKRQADVVKRVRRPA